MAHSISTPTRRTVEEVLGWQPPHGVLSVYLSVDPADRGEGWKIEVRNGLDAAAASAHDRETRLAIEAATQRISAVIQPEILETAGPGLIGFIEAAREEGLTRWCASGLPPRRTEILHGPMPVIGPLVELLDRGDPRGIAVLSSERVRLLHWHLGRIEELQEWELEIFSLDWRERKAPVSRDPAAGEAVSSAGHDQFDQRLEANRERFAEQSGKQSAAEAARREWRQLLVFGDERYARHFATGFADRCPLQHVDSSDLISEPTHAIEDRVEGLLDAISQDHRRKLVEAALEKRCAFGYQETIQALAEGRVEHLLYDCERAYASDGTQGPAELASGQSPTERLIRLALESSAKLTPLDGETAAGLTERGGVVATLRY